MLHSDIPISSMTEDKLNRKNFVMHLSQIIESYSDDNSIAIGLYGKWGSGKTSLVNMTIEEVDTESSDIIIFKFNPWLCSDERQLIIQFYEQLSNTLKRKSDSNTHLCDLIDRYSSLFQVVECSVIMTGNAEIIGVAKIVKSFLRGLLSYRKRKKESKYDEDLQIVKNKIIEEIKKEGIKLLIAIDDIDRLSDKEIISVFKLVKSMADFPKTIYLLAFDYEIVVGALNEVQKGRGKNYLEKIVQVPFEIPAYREEEIHNIFLKFLEEIIGEENQLKWNKDAWIYLFENGIRMYVKTLRDVNRFINVFKIKYSMLRNEVDAVDLLAITCIQVFEPEIYMKIYENKNKLCGLYEKNITDAKGEIEQTFSRLVEDDKENKETIKKILGVLFPRINVNLLKNRNGKYHSYDYAMYYNSIAIEKNFDRYFTMMIGDSETSTKEIEDMIYQMPKNEIEKFLLRVNERGQIKNVINKIKAYGNMHNGDISTERIEKIVNVLMYNFSIYDSKEESLFATPLNWTLIDCICALLSNVDELTGLSFLKTVFNDNNIEMYAITLLLMEFEHQCGRFGNSYNNAVISEELLNDLEGIFVRRSKQCIKQETYKYKKYGLYFTVLLEKIDLDYFMSIKKNIVTDNYALIRVIELYSSIGDVYSVSINEISEYINIDEAYIRIKNLTKNNTYLDLKREEQEVIVAFILTYENKHNQFGHVDKRDIEGVNNEIIGALKTEKSDSE